MGQGQASLLQGMPQSDSTLNPADRLLMVKEAPGELKGRPFSNKANLAKPLTDGKELTGLDREEKRTSPGRWHPCRSWLGNFFLKPLIMGGITTVCSWRSWREEAVGRISSPVLAGMAALMPAVQHVLPPPPRQVTL